MTGLLAGRRALVTGASRGIGRGIASALAEQGCMVAVAARTAEGLAETVALARVGGGIMVAVTADLSDAAACSGLVGRSAEALGGSIDILVHNAGAPSSAKVVDATLADWEHLMMLHATAAFLLAKSVAPAMIANRWGRIVNVGSVYSRVGVPYGSAYVASKHALLGLTRVLALELARYGVTANTLVPGWTDTEMVAEQALTVSAAQGTTAAEAMARFLQTQPIGRLISVDEIGAFVAFLCSQAAAPITGQALGVDGGMYQG